MLALLDEDLAALPANRPFRQHSVSDYAERLYVSQNHLNDTVRQHTGRSAGTIVHDALAKAATGYLVSSTLSVQEIARSFAREGATVIINGRTEKSVEQAQYPDVDILVNNLGIYENHDVFTLTDEDWQRLFEVNIQSGVRLSRHYLPGMIARNTGRVLFISSESAMTADEDMAPYSATKLMQLSISRSLAQRTKGTNVTVNSLLPGSTFAPGVQELVQKVFLDDDFSVGERRFMAENRPTSIIGRLIRPQEIADFAVFVCSGLAGAINGAALRVDGGIYRSAV